jgi:protein pelota
LWFSDKVDFDPQASTLRLKGTNRTESPLIKLGASQTIAIELNRELTLVKSEWDQVSLKRIKDAADPSTTADAAAVVMDEGIATLCLLKANMNVTVASIDVSVPRKRRGSSSQHDEGMKRVLREGAGTRSSRSSASTFSKSCSSPRLALCARRSSSGCGRRPSRLDKKALLEQRAKFVAVHSTSGHKHALGEVLASPEALKLLADTKFAARSSCSRASPSSSAPRPSAPTTAISTCSGPTSTRRSRRCSSPTSCFAPPRSRSAATTSRSTDSVKRNGGEVHIFSALHVSGEQLQQLTGVAAILRYALTEPDDLADNSSDSTSDSDQSAGGGSARSILFVRAKTRRSAPSSSTTRSDATSQTRKSHDDDSISITESEDDMVNSTTITTTTTTSITTTTTTTTTTTMIKMTNCRLRLQRTLTGKKRLINFSLFFLHLCTIGGKMFVA